MTRLHQGKVMAGCELLHHASGLALLPFDGHACSLLLCGPDAVPSLEQSLRPRLPCLTAESGFARTSRRASTFFIWLHASPGSTSPQRDGHVTRVSELADGCDNVLQRSQRSFRAAAGVPSPNVVCGVTLRCGSASRFSHHGAPEADNGTGGVGERGCAGARRPRLVQHAARGRV
jgi:hypothetical protein